MDSVYKILTIKKLEHIILRAIKYKKKLIIKEVFNTIYVLK